ncbi:hypothetical protein PCYB_124850 [Plasmodium cynomolgi strain B]|uniref:Uncharacterized protein n=1 Tax=Plasmodium cynomolgi (strain B) TaxID=1120755 RepID=K6UWA1_PLACD|nr:hypothetical protein PCYB_124850 [Plasmodium cynomolgi strain B]GAB67919.1 hypothetical protein PCYB_124850 [Plasmodium cynomolgi strain B]
MMKSIVSLLLLLAIAFTQMVRLQRTNDVPLINYQMVPSQRKKDPFCFENITRNFTRQYEAESGESPPEKETEDTPPSEKAEMGDQDEASNTFDVNGPIQLI